MILAAVIVAACSSEDATSGGLAQPDRPAASTNGANTDAAADADADADADPTFECEATEGSDTLFSAGRLPHGLVPGDPLPAVLLEALKARWPAATFTVADLSLSEIMLVAEIPDSARPEVRNLRVDARLYRSAGREFWDFPQVLIDVGCRPLP